MTRANQDYLRVTLEVLEGNRSPINDDTTTWLGHATQQNMPQGRITDGQCGRIDVALAKGCFTLAEIAERAGCTEERVKDHLTHLEKNHHLKLMDENGRWSFDKEWLRQRVLQGAVLQYEEPTDPVAETDWDAHQ